MGPCDGHAQARETVQIDTTVLDVPLILSGGVQDHAALSLAIGSVSRTIPATAIRPVSAGPLDATVLLEPLLLLPTRAGEAVEPRASDTLQHTVRVDCSVMFCSPAFRDWCEARGICVRVIGGNEVPARSAAECALSAAKDFLRQCAAAIRGQRSAHGNCIAPTAFTLDELATLVETWSATRWPSRRSGERGSSLLPG
ncbi:hypothetical protein GCM10022248_85570 [Nonomuraea soli]